MPGKSVLFGFCVYSNEYSFIGTGNSSFLVWRPNRSSI